MSTADPERWSTLERLYHAALEKRDARERAAFLDAACAGDAALRADVDSLLAHDPDASGFIDAPALAHLASDLAKGPSRTGDRLGPYLLGALLGAGGMGEVYKAADTRLGRDVAIKVLPPFWSSDPDRRARLEREARAIAGVTHPHICALYDVGRDGDVEYLVLEYVEGETLAERLRRGALPLDEALRVAGQVASALAAAHARGIVHRDLKPANIVLTRSGAKLLDFGLAKLGAPGVVSGVSQPTAAASLTAVGMILGTLQYMSPEQVEGQEADARSDIFAFGAVLHEMVSGAKAFEAKSQASLIAAILEREPAPLPQLRPETPASLARLVRTCLAKDPTQRWQSASDLERELTWIREDLGSTAVAVPRRLPRRRLHPIVAWTVAALAIAIAVWSLVWRNRPPAPGEATLHLELPLPDGASGLARFPTISPDGRHVAFVETASLDHPEKWRIWIQDVGTAEAHPVEGTAGAEFPFWSPDSSSLAFFSAGAKGALRRLDLKTGSILTLCEAPAGRGGTWAADGTIVFAPDLYRPLMRISAQGGSPTPVTTLEPAAQDAGHRLPSFLPDGRHFIFTKRKAEGNVLSVGSLDSPATADIISTPGLASQGIVAAGKLLYVSEGSLVAQDFDTGTLLPHGERVPVVRRVSDDGYAQMAFSASVSGTIVYRTNARNSAQLAVVSRSGARVRTFGDVADYTDLRLSPDGRKVAVGRVDAATDVSSLWVLDVERGQLTPLTTGADSAGAVWRDDGKQLLYQRAKAWALYDIHAIDVDTGRDVTLISTEINAKVPYAWLRDGSVVYGMQGTTGSYVALWRLKPGSTPPGEPIEAAPHPIDAVVSPDGKWMAYTSIGSGGPEIYVQAFPSGARRQITSGGGTNARWSSDGSQLYYLSDDGTKLNAVPVGTSPALTIGAAAVLFDVPRGSSYAPAPDGKTFYVALRQPRARPNAVRVLVNWLRR